MKPTKHLAIQAKRKTTINLDLHSEINLEEDSNNEDEVLISLDMKIYSLNLDELLHDNKVNEGSLVLNSISETSSLVVDQVERNQKPRQKKKKKQNK